MQNNKKLKIDKLCLNDKNNFLILYRRTQTPQGRAGNGCCMVTQDTD